MIYILTHWCPPSRTFTPGLKVFDEKYSELKNFEVIFVSCDSTQNDIQKYFNEMADYLALDFAETEVSVSILGVINAY